MVFFLNIQGKNGQFLHFYCQKQQPRESTYDGTAKPLSTPKGTY